MCLGVPGESDLARKRSLPGGATNAIRGWATHHKYQGPWPFVSWMFLPAKEIQLRCGDLAVATSSGCLLWPPNGVSASTNGV